MARSSPPYRIDWHGTVPQSLTDVHTRLGGVCSSIDDMFGILFRLTYSHDGSITALQATIGALQTATNPLLDGNKHSDTVAQSPVRGSLIVGNATPLWDVLVLGTSGKFLKSDGTDAAWAAITAADVTSGAALTRTNDTNVTLVLGGSPTAALLAATSLTLGWTGTLAAARLNGNVVQAITNDTNVTGVITAQNLAFGWSGQLALSRGGTGLNAVPTDGQILIGRTSDHTLQLASLTAGSNITITPSGGGISIASTAGGISEAQVAGRIALRIV